MKIRGVDYFFYNVSDLKKSLAFYRDVMGLEVTDEQEKWAEFDCGNLTLGIGVFGADPKAAKNGAAVALSVDNVEDVVAELKGKKVKIVTEPMDFPDMCEMAIIADPDGNQIILHHRKDGSVG